MVMHYVNYAGQPFLLTLALALSSMSAFSLGSIRWAECTGARIYLATP